MAGRPNPPLPKGGINETISGKNNSSSPFGKGLRLGEPSLGEGTEGDFETTEPKGKG